MINKEYYINGKYVVECKICGHKAGSLYQHLKKEHNLSVLEYRKEYGNDLLVKRHSMQKGMTKETNESIKLQAKKITGHPVTKETRKKISEKRIQFFNTKKGKLTKKKHSQWLKNAYKTGEMKLNENWKIAGRKAAWKAYRVFLDNETKEDRRKRLDNWINSGHHISIGEIELLKELKNYNIGIIEHSYKIGRYTVDIYIRELNLIIEFYGDYWHCNPKIYKEDYIRRNKVAKNIWEYDKKRLDYIGDLNYNVEVIWESDFNEKEVGNIIAKYKE